MKLSAPQDFLELDEGVPNASGIGTWYRVLAVAAIAPSEQ